MVKKYTKSVAFTTRINEDKIGLIDKAHQKKKPNGDKITLADVLLAGAQAIINGTHKW